MMGTAKSGKARYNMTHKQEREVEQSETSLSPYESTTDQQVWSLQEAFLLPVIKATVYLAVIPLCGRKGATYEPAAR